MSANYYISTGALECFYTLRKTFTEVVYSKDEAGNVEGRQVVRDYYVQNLSTDKAEAIAKARAITGASLDAQFDVRPMGERNAIDWSILQGGKFQGRSIVELAETADGRKYLFFLCENMAHSQTYAKTVELAKPYLKDLYAAADEATRAAAAKRERVAAVLAPLAEALKDGRGGFCDSVAKDMAEGLLPSLNAQRTVADILAKQQGRRNSKAYADEYVRIEQVFASVEG